MREKKVLFKLTALQQISKANPSTDKTLIFHYRK